MENAEKIIIVTSKREYPIIRDENTVCPNKKRCFEWRTVAK